MLIGITAIPSHFIILLISESEAECVYKDVDVKTFNIKTTLYYIGTYIIGIVCCICYRSVSHSIY